MHGFPIPISCSWSESVGVPSLNLPARWFRPCAPRPPVSGMPPSDPKLASTQSPPASDYPRPIAWFPPSPSAGQPPENLTAGERPTPLSLCSLPSDFAPPTDVRPPPVLCPPVLLDSPTLPWLGIVPAPLPVDAPTPPHLRPCPVWRKSRRRLLSPREQGRPLLPRKEYHSSRQTLPPQPCCQSSLLLFFSFHATS